MFRSSADSDLRNKLTVTRSQAVARIADRTVSQQTIVAKIASPAVFEIWPCPIGGFLEPSLYL